MYLNLILTTYIGILGDDLWLHSEWFALCDLCGCCLDVQEAGNLEGDLRAHLIKTKKYKVESVA